MTSRVEQTVRDFYDMHGWSKGGEDELFRQFRPAHRSYHEQIVARTLGKNGGSKTRRGKRVWEMPRGNARSW